MGGRPARLHRVSGESSEFTQVAALPVQRSTVFFSAAPTTRTMALGPTVEPPPTPRLDLEFQSRRPALSFWVAGMVPPISDRPPKLPAYWIKARGYR